MDCARSRWFQAMMAAAAQRLGAEPPVATPAAAPEHFAHETHVVVVGEPIGLRGDGGEHVGKLFHLGLVIIAEHVGSDFSFCRDRDGRCRSVRGGSRGLATR